MVKEKYWLSDSIICFFSALLSEADQQEIGKYAKNYLPLLFNLYTTEKWNHSRDPVRQSVFETIKRYLTITEPALCQTFFDKSLEKTHSSDLEQITL